MRELDKNEMLKIDGGAGFTAAESSVHDLLPHTFSF